MIDSIVKRFVCLLLILLVCFTCGCNRDAKKMTLIIFVDLTESTLNQGNKTRIPYIAIKACNLAKMEAQTKGYDIQVEFRAITSNSYNDDLVSSIRLCNYNIAEVSAFSNKLEPMLIEWFKTYQSQNIKGTDIYGAISKVATISSFIDEGEPLYVLIISDLMHQSDIDPGPQKFQAKTKVMAIIVSDDSAPKLAEKNRQAIQKRIVDCGGTFKFIKDPDVLIQEFSKP